MYHIVIFQKTNEVEVVPSNWINDDKCMWPPNKTDVVKATKNNEQPGKGWTTHSVRIIFTSSKYILFYFVIFSCLHTPCNNGVILMH